MGLGANWRLPTAWYVTTSLYTYVQGNLVQGYPSPCSRNLQSNSLSLSPSACVCVYVFSDSWSKVCRAATTRRENQLQKHTGSTIVPNPLLLLLLLRYITIHLCKSRCHGPSAPEPGSAMSTKEGSTDERDLGPKVLQGCCITGMYQSKKDGIRTHRGE